MDAFDSLAVLRTGFDRQRTPITLKKLFATTIVVGLTIGSTILVLRRIAGGLTEPLSSAALIAFGVILAAVAAAPRLIVMPPVTKGAAKALGFWLPAVAAISFAAAVSLPGSSPWGLAVLWIAIIGEEVCMWRPWRLGPGRSERKCAPRPPAESHLDRPLAAPDQSEAVLSLSGDVVQRLERTKSAAGVDRIEGWLKTELAAGERNATVHAAFCPPFEGLPEFTAIQAEGPEVRIKPVQLLAFGVRLELKLLQSSAERSTVVVHFVAEHRHDPREPAA